MICASVYEFLKPKSILEINHALTQELKMIEHLSSSLTKIDKESVIISLRSWLIPGEELTMKEKIIQQITAIHELGFSQFVFDWEGVENQALILDVIRTINLENNDSNGKSIDIWATVRGRDKNGLLYFQS